MNLKRLMLTASCQGGARGRVARRASAEGEFVRALDETDRLLRIDPPEPDAEAPERIARALLARQPAPPPPHAPPSALPRRWRSAAALAITAGAAAALSLAPVALWRATTPLGARPTLADAPFPPSFTPSSPSSPSSAAPPPDAPRLTWTLVASVEQPLRAEAAALAADMRQFGHLVAPGVIPMPPDEQPR